MAPVGQAFEGASSFLGDAAFDATGSPALGAAAYSIPTMGLEALGLKAARAIPGRQFEMGDIGASGIGRSQRGAVGGVTAKPSTVKDVTAAWESRGIKSFVSEHPDNLVLGKIIVPEGQRSSGAGTQAMQELVDYADSTGKRIDLSPSADFGGNKKRLSEFYKRFGFVDNKGKAKDFEVSETMYRPAGIGGSGDRVKDRMNIESAFNESTGDEAIDAKIKSVVMMSPDEYLRQAYEATDARMGGSFDGWLSSNQRTTEEISKYSDDMSKGDEFPLPYIDRAAGSQDGRNRALAAKQLGIKEIPVGIVPAPTKIERIAEITKELEGSKGYRKFRLEEELKRLQLDAD
jgi:GNAT superfamily N-acetyltransferase